MRLRPFGSFPVLSFLATSLVLTATPATAQSLKAEDATSRATGLVARAAAVRVAPTARNIHDAVRLTAGELAYGTPASLMPYRSAPSEDGPQSGFSMRLPGTGLELTNGSLSLRHANDGRYGKGIHFSVQLTY